MKSQAEAERDRDSGIKLVTDNEIKIDPDWPDRAYAFLIGFATSNPTPFLTETVREAFEKGKDLPHNNKIWGGVMRRAAKANIIELSGYAKARSSNCSPKCLWQSKGETNGVRN